MASRQDRDFGAESTTEQVLDGIDLEGRTAIVTGASGGLGKETARALAAHGCAVTIAARSDEKANAAADEIRAAHPDAIIDVGHVELAEPESVDAFAKQWLADHGPLQLLILNAGIMACPLERTRQGWELQFATNHLGHFLLTARLLPALRAAGSSRVVVLSSGGHAISPVVFDDLHFERRDYDPWASYGQAKSANVLFATELDRRFRSEGIAGFAVHPGMIHTDLGRSLTRELIEQIMVRADESGEPRKSVEQGAATSVWAATAPELADEPGTYLADCSVPGPAEEGRRGYAAHAVDPDAALRLWALSEELLGVRLG